MSTIHIYEEEKNGSAFGLKAGTGYGDLGGDIGFFYMFGTTVKKETTALTSGVPIAVDSTGSYETSGTFYLPINMNYANSFGITEKLFLGYKGNLFFQFARTGGDAAKDGGDTINMGAVYYYRITPTIDLGLKYAINKKFSLYSGLSKTLHLAVA